MMVESVIGNYRILSKIGEGGMGAVYLAEHALLGRRAAIKLLLRELSHRHELITRFFHEARAATAVDHPGIVEVYDFGYHSDGTAYLVMEYLDGESLSARLERTGPFAEVRAAALCCLVASALGAAHAAGIVHRDLKPDNIHIVRDPDIVGGERPKILDFGIAKLSVDDLSQRSMTRTGTVMGTPGYMSPEQCKGAAAVDHRADLYALGCILFEMVCGRSPFIAEGAGEVMAQHIYVDPPAPSSIAPVTAQLEQVILRLLAKDPAQRFQTAQDVIAALSDTAPPKPVRVGPTVPTVLVRTAPDAARNAAQPRTTLSQASAVTSTASAATSRLRRWWLPVAAAATAASTAVMLSGLRGDRRDDAFANRAPEQRPPELGALAPPPAADVAPPGPVPAAETAPPAPPVNPVSAPAPRPGITIKLASEPAGADVYRIPQEVRIGRTPLVYAMDALDGELVLVVDKSGYQRARITVPADRDSERNLALVRVAVKPRPHDAATTSVGSGAVERPVGGSLDPFDNLATGKPENKP